MLAFLLVRLHFTMAGLGFGEPLGLLRLVGAQYIR
ncbi:MAG: hypothetical protein ETSY2_18330 [Candidatus Entotheonella gemina]|uniref:Uncharacterized protein n=1 Tax=Candidatus Entotheonella gemina TaxID=1429439 RepID=W4M8K8_9BACT|nr:MAG: hypothetical protein ETSY2_18330 [Candidatus Entotheonella gemina]